MSESVPKSPRFPRILLKLSGEALMGTQDFGIDPKKVALIVDDIAEAATLGTSIALVVGGGNIWRGKIAAEMGMERSSADYMGMIATILNALALQNAIEELGVEKSEVTLEANLRDDLGADSLDAVELVMAIEDSFDIKVSDEVAQGFQTVKQIVEYIEGLK